MVYFSFACAYAGRGHPCCSDCLRRENILTYSDHDPETITQEQLSEMLRLREIPVAGRGKASRKMTERICRHYEDMLPKRNVASDPAEVEVIAAVIGIKNNEIRKVQFRMPSEEIKRFADFCTNFSGMCTEDRTYEALNILRARGLGYVHPMFMKNIVVAYQCPCASNHAGHFCNLDRKANKRSVK